MKKKERELLKKLLGRSLTVGKLKEILADLPDDMPVGRVGHFGEFCSMWETPARVRKSYVGQWHTNDRIDLEVLDLETPDIGPVPD